MQPLDLASQFRARAEARGGHLWLSAKQAAFLRSLATPVYRGSDLRGVGPVISETVHGRTQIHAHFADGEMWTCTIAPNGAGVFSRAIGS